MIKISTKTRYALRALLEMACRRNGQKLFSLGELSRHQNISRKYLEIIFSTLRKRDIVASRVGKNGGFYLPADLSHISLLKILETLEGKVDIVDCQNPQRKCKRFDYCAAKGIWQELNTSVKNILASKNLKELSEQKEIREKCTPGFLQRKKH
ncbi:MAG: Rrf2 family transcriptional regulator [Candidatus Omnitrophota bacterium]